MSAAAGACRPFGTHLLVDIDGCDPGIIRSRRKLRRLLRVLCVHIGMQPYRRARLHRFALHDPVAAGYTGVQLITTSHMILHISEARRTVYLDVFSCGDFEPVAAGEFAAVLLGGQVAARTVITRQ